MEKTKPKVSVIIPVYGVEKYLKQCLNSVLNQTLKELEIIIIDDGGKDNCPQIIDEYASKDNRIIAIHKENGGYGHTCNRGLEIASGEYIAIVEPDDYIDEKMYENLYNIAKNHDSDVVKSCFYDNLQSTEKKRIKKVQWNDYIPENKSFTIYEYPYFLYYHPSIWSCIYKNEFLKKYSLHFVEAPGAGWTDNPFQVQTMCLAERINYTSKAYYYWRRVNVNESDDLKDYSLPFKRSEEIHQWLEENNINNEKILINLYMRELAYINIVLNKKYSRQEFKNVQNEIEKMLARMDFRIITNCSSIKKRIKKNFLELKTNFNLFYIKLKLKNILKNLISIRWNKEERAMILLGKYWRFD